jgi:hypothetical protein
MSRSSRYAALAALASLTVAVNMGPSAAQTSAQDYRYCALGHGGATVCYFNDRATCGDRCIENPSYSSAFAMTPASSGHKSGRVHRARLR